MFDQNKTWWDLCWERGKLISRGESRDVVLQENVSRTQALNLAYNLKRPSEITKWMRIEL